MKLGIVTFTYGDNYGQRLQNFAVQETLKTFAEEVCTIPQKPRHVSKKTRIKRFLKQAATGTLSVSRKRREAFRNFDRNFIRYYPHSPENGVLEGEADFDAFFVGSDQVWSPYSPDVNDSMFLTFAPPEKRFAFSPSVAASDIPEDKKEAFRQHWLEFSRLSVREDRGAQLIRELTGKVAEVLADPTMMLPADRWRSIAAKPAHPLPEQYAVFYYLGEYQNVEHIRAYCRENRIEIIDLMGDRRFKTLGPAEFIHLLDHARLVVTDSFHGTLFSMMLHTPFVICERSGTGVNMSSRFETLYRIFGIGDRKLENCPVSRMEAIDFSLLDAYIIREQEKVRAYLKQCLG